MTVGRGDVVWISAASGRRPHVVLTRAVAIPLLNGVLAAPVTRSVRGIPTEVPLGPEDGMPQDCAVALDNVQFVHRSTVRGHITTLSSEKMRAVCRALAIATGCDAT